MTYPPAFVRAVAAVLTHEGGYTYDSADPGGETNRGISRRSYPDVDIANLTDADATAIYYRDWWCELGLDLLPSMVAAKLLDTAVHMGRHGAVTVLQEALRYLGRSVLVDGVLGPETRTAVMSVNKQALLAAICGRQFREYERQICSQPTKQKFAAGWAIRAIWVPA